MEDNQQNPQDSGKVNSWKSLSDTQKAQVLLGSPRLPDTASFIETYASFEQPTIDYDQETKTEADEITLQGTRGYLKLDIILRERYCKPVNRMR